MTSTDTGMDLEALRDGVHGVLVEQASHERVAAFTDANEVLDRTLWGSASELGWLALSSPEDHGGLGLGPAAADLGHQHSRHILQGAGGGRGGDG